MKKTFDKLSEAEKRVEIAKDVLKYSEAGILEASYTYANIHSLRFLDKEKSNSELNTLVLNDNLECEVCGIGALFIADVLRNNNFKAKELDYGEVSESKIIKRLTNFFSKKQLDMIECAYEVQIIRDRTRVLKNHTTKNQTALANLCIEFGDNYFSRPDRLKAIMKNIIKNNGEFIPGKGNDSTY